MCRLNATEVYQTLSLSYGVSEDTQTRAFARRLCGAFAALGARGTSVLVASGDGGVCGALPGNCTRFGAVIPADCPWSVCMSPRASARAHV
jgi:tripeptidyl-peptidase-1